MTSNNNNSSERKIKGSVLEYLYFQQKKTKSKLNNKNRKKLLESSTALIIIPIIVSMIYFSYSMFMEVKELYVEGSITRCDYNTKRDCDRIVFNPISEKYEPASYEIISLEQSIGENFISSIKVFLFTFFWCSLFYLWEYVNSKQV
jgi:hypothetical protein